MLYLNSTIRLNFITSLYLTLTSVVFEFSIWYTVFTMLLDLTLTSVVFELTTISSLFLSMTAFKFNKCCIWIQFFYPSGENLPNLTLTSVVFELAQTLRNTITYFHLTLTSVVFELP